MPLKIPQDVRAAVRRDWLNGKPRDTIARDNSLSTGSVSSIINELRNDLTRTDADALRELGIMLTKSGISASECALGFRLASIIKEMGVDEDNFGHFISQVYNKCKDTGLQPEHIAKTIQILELTGSMPVSEIPEYIQKKTSEKQKLEEEIKNLEDKELDARTTLALALDDNNVYLSQLEHFYNLKVELNRIGIPVEDIQRTVKIIQGVQKSGYNVYTIIQRLTDWEASTAIQVGLQNSIEKLQKDYDDLSELISTVQQKLSLCKQLEEMGCGLNQLKWLFGTIKEVAAANNTANNTEPNRAVQKFFEDIEKNYDNKLGYDSILAHLRNEILKTNYELTMVQQKLAYTREVALVLGELFLMGFSYQQIFNLASALQSNASNKESLEADLNKYGSLKKSIEHLIQELRILETQKKPGLTDRLNIPKKSIYQELMPWSWNIQSYS